MTYRPTIYTASKLWHAPRWRALRYSHPEYEFTARWIDHVPEMEANATPALFAHYWTMDIQDVQRSDFTLVYRNGDDVLKGGLVEAGAALGAGKIVVAVGLGPEHSWSFHPRVVRFDELKEIFPFFKRYLGEPIS